MAQLLQQGAWEDVGRMLSEFWTIKRELATPTEATSGGHDCAPCDSPAAEPSHVTAFLADTSSLSYGAALSGGGGGGFLALLCPPANHAALRVRLDQFNVSQARNHTQGQWRT